jgi:hypothetical protein
MRSLSRGPSLLVLWRLQRVLLLLLPSRLQPPLLSSSPVLWSELNPLLIPLTTIALRLLTAVVVTAVTLATVASAAVQKLTLLCLTTFVAAMSVVMLWAPRAALRIVFVVTTLLVPL